MIGNYIGNFTGLTAGALSSIYSARVAADGGVTESFTCLQNRIALLRSLGFWDYASAVWLPHGYKEGKLYAAKGGSGADFGFTRGGTKKRKAATYVEEVPYNLVQYSEQFDNAVWGKTGPVTVTANQINDPVNGLPVGDLITATAGGVTVYSIRQSYFLNANTFSVDIKMGTHRYVGLTIYSGNANIAFDLQTGVVGTADTGYTGNMVSLGNGWYRCSVSSNASAFGLCIISLLSANVFTATSWAPAGTETIYVHGAKLSVGSINYFSTTNRFHVPPLDYTPRILEAQGTNLILQSETFDNASWTKDAVTVTANAVNSPINTLTADALFETGANSGHSAAQTITKSAVSIQYTISLSVKPNGRDWFAFQLGNGANAVAKYFNITTGVVGTTLTAGTGFIFNSASIIPQANGFYRCVATITSDATTLAVVTNYIAIADGTAGYVGDVAKGIYFWGAQLEQASKAHTNYGVTTTASAPIPAYFDPAPCPSISLEPARTNLLLQSEAFDNASWTKIRTTVTANSIAGPENLTTADTLFETVEVGAHFTTQQVTKAASVLQYTVSIRVKPNGRNFIRLSCAIGANGIGKYFDIGTGAVGTTFTAGTGFVLNDFSITPTANGFYICSITITTDAGTALDTALVICTADGVESYAGDVTKGVYLHGAQLEQASYATSYIKTEAATVSRVADAVPALFPAGTNQILQSETFENASWTKVEATVTANVINSPINTLTADRVLETIVNATHRVEQVVSKPAVSMKYSFTAYVKGGLGRDWILLQCASGANGAGNWFNITTGVKGAARVAGAGWTSDNATITADANGFYRLEINVTSAAEATIESAILVSTDGATLSYVGDITKGMYVWGSQLEQGNVATPYIATTTVPLHNGTVIGQTEGTLYFEGSSFADGTHKVIGIGDGTVNNEIVLNFGSANTINVLAVSGGVTQASLTGPAFVTGTKYKVAVTYITNKIALFVNGVKSAEDLVATIGPSSQVMISENGANIFYGRKEAFVISKTALTDSEAINWTTL